MSEERMKVLEMLGAGKISAEEAERLLERIGGRSASGGSPAGEVDRTGAGGIAKQRNVPPRYLRVLVDSEGGDKVNIRVPLKLIRTGIKLGAMLPTEASAQLASKGIDLAGFSEMGADELLEALDELEVDVDGEDTVRIFCE